ncbi:hypothetical protein, partial [Mesorhizobium sp. M0965]|uniref:hypothetical protein n=1 Tax=Mesorhizobium sp. M0965 TaxID=2957036 RepID=UPI003337C25E
DQVQRVTAPRMPAVSQPLAGTPLVNARGWTGERYLVKRIRAATVIVGRSSRQAQDRMERRLRIVCSSISLAYALELVLSRPNLRGDGLTEANHLRFSSASGRTPQSINKLNTSSPDWGLRVRKTWPGTAGWQGPSSGRKE